MAEYYVDGINGDDSNSGTSKDQAWATVDKAMQTLSAGDICHIAPGRYYKSSAYSPANSGNATDGYIEFIGDPNGEIFGRQGEVILTNSNNYGQTWGDSKTIDLSGKSYIKFEKLVIYGSRGAYGGSSLSYIWIEDCVIWAVHRSIQFTYVNNLTIKRNVLGVWEYDETIQLGYSDTAGEGNSIIENNVILNGDNGGVGIFLYYKNAKIFHNLIAHSQYAGIRSYKLDTSSPAIAKYNVIYNTYYCIYAYASGEITEDWNILKGYKTYNNVTQGSNTKICNPELRGLNFIPSDYWNRYKASFIPMVGEGWQNYITDPDDPTTEDIFGNPRPLGTGKTPGPVEYFPPAQKETTEVRTGSYSLKLPNASFKDIKTFLSTGSYTISVYTKWSGYSGTDKPQLIVKQDKYCGINSDQIVTATGDGTSWEQLSVNITLTKDAEITIRLYARDTGSSAVTYFDDLDIS